MKICEESLKLGSVFSIELDELIVNFRLNYCPVSDIGTSL